MPDADNIDLTLSLAIPRAFIFSRGIDINVYFLPSSTTSHSSDTPSIFPSSHSALFIWWCQHLGKAWMRVDKKECYLDKPTFSGKVSQLGWHLCHECDRGVFLLHHMGEQGHGTALFHRQEVFNIKNLASHLLHQRMSTIYHHRLAGSSFLFSKRIIK